MYFNHLKGAQDQRFVRNDSVESIMVNKKYKKQAMFVNMSLERSSTIDNRNVYDLDNPIKKIPVKYPDIRPHY
jgi:hypothetical protein